MSDFTQLPVSEPALESRSDSAGQLLLEIVFSSVSPSLHHIHTLTPHCSLEFLPYAFQEKADGGRIWVILGLRSFYM